MTLKTPPECFKCVRADCDFNHDGRCVKGETDWENGECLTYSHREKQPLPDDIRVYILRQIIADAEVGIRKYEAAIAEILPDLESLAGTVVEVVRWKDHKCMDW